MKTRRGECKGYTVLLHSLYFRAFALNFYSPVSCVEVQICNRVARQNAPHVIVERVSLINSGLTRLFQPFRHAFGKVCQHPVGTRTFKAQ